MPRTKTDEIQAIMQVVSAFEEVQMLILFGSYATGKWVEDQYMEKGITYEYQSDYDLLVVLENDDIKLKFAIDDALIEKLVQTHVVKTTINPIFHGIKHINHALKFGNYFFSDIKKEGILLYDSGNFTLDKPIELTPAQHKQKAQDHFDRWFEGANNFLKLFDFAYNEGDLNEAAFLLHQTAERYYTTILLVFTDYRPKDHNLEKLGLKAEMCNKSFAGIFPTRTDKEKRLFELLKKAYIDARYKMDEYSIEREELEYLEERVKQLQMLTEKICKEKIAQFEN